MRIGLLSRGFPPECPDGIPRIREILAQGFAARGHTVHVITQGKGSACESRDGYHIHRIPPHLAERFFASGQPAANAWLTYSQAVSEILAGAIESAGGRLDLLDSPLWEIEGFTSAMNRPDLPVVVRIETTSRHVHEINGFAFDERRRFEKELEELFTVRAQGLLFDSRSAREEFERLYGSAMIRGRCAVIYHGVPLPEWPSMGCLDVPGYRILSVGRLEKRKGTLHLFEVIRRVLNAEPKARFILAGRDNSANDGFAVATGCDYPAWFREKYPHLMDRVDFLGLIDAKALAEEYARADVAVVPSIYESFGLTYLEAMGYAKPVVAFDIGGAREIFTHGEDGLLVPVGDEAAMAEAVINLLREGFARRRLGENGRRRAEEAFTPERMIEETLLFYEQVIRRTGI